MANFVYFRTDHGVSAINLDRVETINPTSKFREGEQKTVFQFCDGYKVVANISFEQALLDLEAKHI